ncbi:hypothetical protein FIBSPDRAFT_1039641 [Athelia psychrophila]|uniref:DUF6534 domain-containing protein n=1 Tax=Athelia psychrophila TaxID=1759441 RepID=A0A166RQM5_9AGAM|nr:hypothetical protein FIBSPDRAFT_1039641 [Fibularhizoctonia sp. CBS 109695]
MSLNNSLGAIEVGALISVFLFGVVSVQVYIYYVQDRPKDPWRIRLLVPAVWIVDALQTGFIIKYIYQLTVTQYGDISAIGEPSWAFNTSALFDGIMGGLVQSFFAHRIYVLSNKWPITIISWFGSFCVVAMDIAIMVLAQTETILAFDAKYSPLVTTVLVTQLTVDLINTSSLCYLLRIEKTGFESTDGTLNKLFIWTIQTGIVTSLAAILTLVFELALPKTSLWVAISIFYSKLYSNSLMASLNGRKVLRDKYNEDTHELSSIRVDALAAMQYPSQEDPESALKPLARAKRSIDKAFSFGSHDPTLVDDVGCYP